MHWRRTAKHPGVSWEGTLYMVLIMGGINFGLGFPLWDSFWWWLAPAVGSLAGGLTSLPIERWIRRRRERRSPAV
jgi:hypothetical protein